MAGIGYPLLWPAAHYENGRVPSTVADLDQQTRDAMQRTNFAMQEETYAPQQTMDGALGQWTALGAPQIPLTAREAKPFVVWSLSLEYTTSCDGGMTCNVGSTILGTFGIIITGADMGFVANTVVQGAGSWANITLGWRTAKVPAGACIVIPGVEVYAGYTVFVRNVTLKAGAM